MRPGLAVRELALAALALLAVVAALAFTTQTRHTTSDEPRPVGSFLARAGSSGSAAFGRHTACGGVIHADTIGVGQPTLPCGARIFITYGHTTVLTQVIDRGPYAPGEQFALTDALARRLGIEGIKVVHWSYAGAP